MAKATRRAAGPASTTRSRLARAVRVALLLAGAAPLAHADVDWEASILTAVGYVDNIELAPPGQPRSSDFATQVTPRLVLVQSNQRVSTVVDYTLRNYFFAEDSEFDNSSQQATANFDWMVVRDWLQIDADGGLFQQMVDPTGPLNSENVFVTRNEADTLTANVTPRLLHRFSNAELEARFTYGIVRYDEGPDGNEVDALLDESNNRLAFARLQTPDPDAPIYWGLEYESDSVDYELALPYRYERAQAGLGYLVGSGLRLVGEGGLESDLATDPTVGGFDETFWRAGIRWEINSRNSVVAMFGRRFFGDTYEFRWNRRARLLELEMRYVEEPTTESRRTTLRPQNDPALPPPPPDIGIPRLTPEAFVSRQYYARAALTGRLTEIALTASSERREYLQTAGEDRVVGIDLRLTRRLSALTDLELIYDTLLTEYRDETESTYNRVALALNRRVGPTIDASVDLAYFDRWGDGPADYRGWFVNLQLTKRFGGIGAGQEP